jgi:hypothetical protein
MAFIRFGDPIQAPLDDPLGDCCRHGSSTNRTMLAWMIPPQIDRGERHGARLL